MRRTRAKIIGGVIAVLVVVGIVLTGADLLSSSARTPSAITFDHMRYVRSFDSTTIGKTRISLLVQWPKPYQSYHDQSGHSCFEWWDKPLNLYNLCFRKGVLITKSIT